jgi:hypothetical protein
MDTVTAFLSDNPLIALALGILAIVLVLSVLKKLFKLALIIGIVLLLSGGTVYHFAKKQVDTRGRELLLKGKELLREGAERVEKRLTAEAPQSEVKKDSAHRNEKHHAPKKANLSPAAKHATEK